MLLAKLLGEVNQKLAVFDALAPVFGHGIMPQVGAADGPGNGSNRIGVTACVRPPLDCRSIVFRKPENAGKRAGQCFIRAPTTPLECRRYHSSLWPSPGDLVKLKQQFLPTLGQIVLRAGISGSLPTFPKHRLP
jgi:hypothetical protein